VPELVADLKTSFKIKLYKNDPGSLKDAKWQTLPDVWPALDFSYDLAIKHQ